MSSLDPPVIPLNELGKFQRSLDNNCRIIARVLMFSYFLVQRSLDNNCRTIARVLMYSYFLVQQRAEKCIQLAQMAQYGIPRIMVKNQIGS